MEITVIGSTYFEDLPDSVKNTEFGKFHQEPVSYGSADRLAHFAGRSCYQSWQMPNSDTATDAGYLANIIKQQHFSVLEHASVTFYVEGVSRALLTELTRHRHLNYSVESQRYVDYSKTKPIYPPAADAMARERLDIAYTEAVEFYEKAVEQYISQGFKRKEAREAARAHLPNSAPVSMVVTGNHRAWREVISKRNAPGADKEIQLFAAEILRQLKEIAPACYQDM